MKSIFVSFVLFVVKSKSFIGTWDGNGATKSRSIGVLPSSSRRQFQTGFALIFAS